MENCMSIQIMLRLYVCISQLVHWTVKLILCVRVCVSTQKCFQVSNVRIILAFAFLAQTFHLEPKNTEKMRFSFPSDSPYVATLNVCVSWTSPLQVALRKCFSIPNDVCCMRVRQGHFTMQTGGWAATASWVSGCKEGKWGPGNRKDTWVTPAAAEHVANGETSIIRKN